MAAPTIPPIRLGLTGPGLAVEKPLWPALCRHVVSAFTDFSGEQSRLVDFADAVLGSLPGQHISSSASFAA
jgi:hypothetical protein